MLSAVGLDKCYLQFKLFGDCCIKCVGHHKLNMKHYAAKFIPCLLTPKQKECREWICENLRPHAVDEPTIVTGIIAANGSWFYGCNPETEQQLYKWKGPSFLWLRKLRQGTNSIRSMLTVFFDICGIAHWELVPLGQTVNKEFVDSLVSVKFWGTFRTAFDKSVRICGMQSTGFSTMAMLLLTSTFGLRFSQQMQHDVASTPELFHRFGSRGPLPFP